MPTKTGRIVQWRSTLLSRIRSTRNLKKKQKKPTITAIYCSSSTASSSDHSGGRRAHRVPVMRVVEFRASDRVEQQQHQQQSSNNNKKNNHRQQQQQPRGTLYRLVPRTATDPLVDSSSDNSRRLRRDGWKVGTPFCGASSSRKRSNRTTTQYNNTLSDEFYQRVLKHFLPARYPHSVAPGYAQYSLCAFLGSVAGSIGMVLSTQTLLLAVGVVGASQSSAGTAGVMAGALNWVLKDGVGQLGGVLFASYAGQGQRFDSNPKRWRMVAALCLDAAALLELVCPWAGPSAVLPVACTANVLKNVGFITASASRAALHQSLCRAGNLGDVTAKCGSQSMAAGLVGTGLGIGASKWLGQDASNFLTAFFVLALIHQGCNYLSLLAVPLPHFNRHRLYLVLDRYMETQQVYTPAEVGQREAYLPSPLPEDDAHSWLSVGKSLPTVAPDGFEELQKLLLICNHGDDDESAAPKDGGYLVNIPHDPAVDERRSRVELIFRKEATGEDCILGMYHACLLRPVLERNCRSDRELIMQCIAKTRQVAHAKFPALLHDLHAQGWNTATEVTNIEPAGALRVSILAPTMTTTSRPPLSQ